MKHHTEHGVAKYDAAKLLQDAFEAPPPTRKDAFMRALLPPRISNFSFMLLQAGYIRKWVWLLSAALALLSLSAACFLEQDILQMLSALIPFVAMSAGIESGRSGIYAMAELEMASRFSLKSVLLARMGILGISHLFLLCILIPLGSLHSAVDLLQAGAYLLTPYLCTTVSGLWISRKIRGKEAFYAYIGTAAAVSIGNAYIRTSLPEYFQAGYLCRWAVLLILLAAAGIYEFTKIIEETEELRWNLS